MAISDFSVKPTTTVTPDTRFGTTFLSLKYRDRAVNGEAIMDKSSGELYLKRADGKIVSFYQNKKLIEELATYVGSALDDNPNFRYPSVNDDEFFVSMNYDLVAINNEVLYNIFTDDVYILGAPNDINKLTFNVGKNTNGFFCRNCTRDVDKPLVEVLTRTYNNYFKNYSGSNEAFIFEKNKFANPKWENCNATIVYSLVTTKNGNTTMYNNLTDYIRLNEDTCVIFPEEAWGFDSANVTILAIMYDKFHTIYHNYEAMDPSIADMINKFIFYDNQIEVNEFNVMHYVNTPNDIIKLGNEFIVAFMDMVRIQENIDRAMHMRNEINNFRSELDQANAKFEYLNEKVELAAESAGIIVSDTQPDFECAWFRPMQV